METFFEVEVEMEKDVCRDLVCTSPKDEEGLIFNITLCEQSQVRGKLAGQILGGGVLAQDSLQREDRLYVTLTRTSTYASHPEAYLLNNRALNS